MSNLSHFMRRGWIVSGVLVALLVGVVETPVSAASRSLATTATKVVHSQTSGFGAGLVTIPKRFGAQSTSTAPSITEYSVDGSPVGLYVAYVASNGSGDILVTSSTDGSTWSAPTNTGQRTKMTPAISEDVVDNTLVIAYVADNSSSHLLVTTSTNGTTWSPSAQVGGQSSKTAPSLTGWTGGTDFDLIMTYVANNSSNDLIVTTGTNNTNGTITWSADETVGTQSSKTAPAISTFDDEGAQVIAYVANNSSNDLIVTTSTNGDASDWSSPTRVGTQSSQTAPTLCELLTDDSDSDVMAYVANNSSNDLIVTTSTDGSATDWSADVTVDGESSKAAPGLPDLLINSPLAMVYVANNSKDHLLLTTSGNGGATWSPSSKVKS